jgi:aminoglycoside phosphotransferase (APT) family kinase protein
VLERVGVALSELHSQSAAGLRCKPPGDRGASLEKRAAWVAAVCEDVARPAKALAARLADGLVQQAPELCAIHGDFSPAQVLLNGAAPAIIDLDAAGRGDPVADLGSFAAHLERQALDGKLPRVLVELFRKSLLTGYESHGGSQVVDPARLRLWTAVELLRRAPGAFRRRRDGWRAHVAALIAQAEKVLDAPDV